MTISTITSSQEILRSSFNSNSQISKIGSKTQEAFKEISNSDGQKYKTRALI